MGGVLSLEKRIAAGRSCYSELYFARAEALDCVQRSAGNAQVLALTEKLDCAVHMADQLLRQLESRRR